MKRERGVRKIERNKRVSSWNERLTPRKKRNSMGDKVRWEMTEPEFKWRNWPSS